jgi:kynurenine formamidase
MKYIFFIVLLFAVACKEPPAKKSSLSDVLASGTWVDLTYSFDEKTIYWPNNPTGFKLDTQFNGITPAGFYYSSNQFAAPEHGGTHLDAPVHFAKGKWSSDQIPIQNLTGNAVVIDVSSQAAANADYLITVADVEAWEKTNGKIPDNAVLLFKTGWGKYYPDAAKYIGTAEKGAAALPKLHFPSISPELAEWLVKNRNIKAIGIDTASVDYGQSKDFKTHQIIYAENIIGFENVANIEKLPVKGAYIIALPMKIKDGTGGPLRLIAWLPGIAD